MKFYFRQYDLKKYERPHQKDKMKGQKKILKNKDENVQT